mmetsp:Transcript_34979/g.89376  ORF Transcript_34979/g.89376 Transcript_34979/m.89376 type:complete len:469 (-) Transcript_34979:50-1456(-)
MIVPDPATRLTPPGSCDQGVGNAWGEGEEAADAAVAAGGGVCWPHCDAVEEDGWVLVRAEEFVPAEANSWGGSRWRVTAVVQALDAMRRSALNSVSRLETCALDALLGRASGPAEEQREWEAATRSGGPWVPYSELKVHKRTIAAGSWKTICKGRHCPTGRDVAVIFMRKGGGDLAGEAGVFRRLGRHPNLTQLVGMSRVPGTDSECMLLELAPLGSLDRLLAEMDEAGAPVGWSVLLTAGMQVCEGMCLLEEHGLVHRDLACRNVLVFSFDPRDRAKLRVKLCDYGLTFPSHRAGGGGAPKDTGEGDDIPWRFIPPEVASRRAWSHKSDAWSFGVLLWEAFSPGRVPYEGEESDEQVGALVRAGVTLGRPAACPAAVHAVMRRCWRADPAGRPSFGALRVMLQDAYAAAASPSLRASHSCECGADRPPSVDGELGGGAAAAARGAPEGVCTDCGGLLDGALGLVEGI